MKEFALKYGCNPNQKPARIFMENGELPLRVLNGNPGYINFLDALNGWQLVRELRQALNMPAAASFKHVSPAGAAIGLPLDEKMKQMYFAKDIEGLELSPLACAYARARGTDRLSSFGDWIALSDVCDEVTAALIKPEVSDGVIAPDYTPKALEILKGKRRGGYNIVAIDPSYEPESLERKQVFGITFEQNRNDATVTDAIFSSPVTAKKELPEQARRDLTIAMITLKYTQSNSVCYAYMGQTIGIGAGQQSRIHCTRIAGDKADAWLLRRHESVLTLPFLPELGRPERDNAIDAYISSHSADVLNDGAWQRFFSVCPAELTQNDKREYLNAVSGVSLGSDAFFPFADNIDRAYMSGVSYVAQPGGSVRDDLVTKACDDYGMVTVHTGMRLFHH